MTSINNSLNIGSQSLHTSQQGVDTASHNIANAEVEGYSRQRVNVEPRAPNLVRGQIIGTGVRLKNITRAHDGFLENQLVQTNFNSGYSQALHEGLLGLEDIFSPQLSASISEEMSAFFDALQDLSQSPDDATIRSNVRDAGQNLINAFKRVDDRLKASQTSYEENIQIETAEVNDILKNIADLNYGISNLEGGTEQVANDYRDQRDALVRKLSEKLNINYYEDRNGMLVVRGPGEVSFVEGRNCASVDFIRDADSNTLKMIATDFNKNGARVFSDHIAGGKLKALFELRDKTTVDLLQQNNRMARSFIDGINAVHMQGYGTNNFKETTGRNFFAPISDGDNVVRDMSLSSSILGSVDAIASGSTPNSPSDNVIVNEMLRVRSMPIMDQGQHNGVTDYYAHIVGSLGTKIAQASHNKDADDLLRADLTARRESVAGVSLDEEAINLMRWQANFAASSKIITTCDEMLDTILSLKR